MCRLLIADDEELVRRGLVALIEREAPDLTIVGTAVDGQDALEAARRARPEIVLTDIRMPGLDGLELISRLRAEQPELRCIILSGYDEFAYARRAIGLGVEEYLLKPVDPDDLLATLARARRALTAERHERDLLTAARQIAAEQGLRRLLDGQPGAVEALETCLPAAVAWALLLVQEQPAVGRRADLAVACRAAMAAATVIEDAYGYICALLPFPAADTGLVGDAAAALQRALHQAGRQASVVAARPCTALPGLGATYSEALQVAEYACAREGGAPIPAWEVLSGVRERWPMLPAPQRDALLAAVAAGQEEDAARAARGFIAHVAEHLPPGALRALWLEIVVLVIHHVQQFGVRADAVLESGHDPRTLLAEARDAALLEGRLVLLARRAAAECGRLRRCQAPRGAIPELRDYIAAHLGDDLTITTLARRMHLNAKYLGELFKQATGESLGAYIIRMRMRKACDLLSSTDLRVYSIAEQVGYADPKHFASMFRSVIGVPPGEYREQQRSRRATSSGGEGSPCNA
jgi:two-component system response regulator YesN